MTGPIMSGTLGQSTAKASSREAANLRMEIFEFLCVFHRVRRLPSKDTIPGLLSTDPSLSEEQRGDLLNRSLYKILNDVELRIAVLPPPTAGEPTPTEEPHPPQPHRAPVWTDYHEEWAFLAWNLLAILHRIQADDGDGGKTARFLDYGGRHFEEKINSALVDLVNKARRMTAPASVPSNDPHFATYYQAYVSTLIALHELYTMAQQGHFSTTSTAPPPNQPHHHHNHNNIPVGSSTHQHQPTHHLHSLTPIQPHHQPHRQQLNPTSREFESRLALFREQLARCLQAQRDFCVQHNTRVWHAMRTAQVERMTLYGYDNRGFMEPALAFYSHMLYNLGVLAARLQGFYHELCESSGDTSSGDHGGQRNGNGGAAGRDGSDLDGHHHHNFTASSMTKQAVTRLLRSVYDMVDVLLADSIVCVEPSQNPILVTNNLFPMKVASLCRSCFFKDFSLQVVGEETAQQWQQEMRHLKTTAFDMAGTQTGAALRPTVAAALLAMKPSTGVKRNNATASAEGGGNTAHKKSDVNSREWISIPPSFDVEHGGWTASYPHLLCTTRQKDSLLETHRQVGSQSTGKRPLFYFHVKAEIFSFFGPRAGGGGASKGGEAGWFTNAHTLSLPFTIATRRNQDCQVQRMLSSYTATCFWLYGTKVLDGLLVQWYDNEIDWALFKSLYAQYFALNAEVHRSLTDEDFNILRQKMHCQECGGGGVATPTSGSQEKCVGGGAGNQHPSLLLSLDDDSNHHQQQRHCSTAITFKNVLCPHLHYAAEKTDLRFSVWRGMLELLHLFSDQRTQVKMLWECGILQGFMELETVHSLLRQVDSGLVARLSFVVGGCICFTVKTPYGQLLQLEPLEVKRLQSKSLHDYLRDIVIAERLDFILTTTSTVGLNLEWLPAGEALKRCRQPCLPTPVGELIKEWREKGEAGGPTSSSSSSAGSLASWPTHRTVTSNVMNAGGVEAEQTIRFTTLRVAVVTCKSGGDENGGGGERGPTPPPAPRHSTTLSSTTSSMALDGCGDEPTAMQVKMHRRTSGRGRSFEERLEELMNEFGKRPMDVLEVMRTKLKAPSITDGNNMIQQVTPLTAATSMAIDTLQREIDSAIMGTRSGGGGDGGESIIVAAAPSSSSGHHHHFMPPSSSSSSPPYSSCTFASPLQQTDTFLLSPCSSQQQQQQQPPLYAVGDCHSHNTLAPTFTLPPSFPFLSPTAQPPASSHTSSAESRGGFHFRPYPPLQQQQQQRSVIHPCQLGMGLQMAGSPTLPTTTTTENAFALPLRKKNGGEFRR